MLLGESKAWQVSCCLCRERGCLTDECLPVASGSHCKITVVRIVVVGHVHQNFAILPSWETDSKGRRLHIMHAIGNLVT